MLSKVWFIDAPEPPEQVMFGRWDYHEACTLCADRMRDWERWALLAPGSPKRTR
ncbi:hypothetical protein ABZ814_23560 [Micromonospora musae]|uniref:hypothetical protein n=1 Tax=Micromonospora musae TaxID=1894970 RepID=UPI0033DF8F55